MVIGTIAPARGPHKRINRDDAATTEIFGALECDARRLFPFEPVLGLELDAGDHCRIDVAASPVTHRSLERVDPAAISDVTVFPRANLREQLLRPHLEVEANVLHELFGVELFDHVVRYCTRP